MLSPSFFSDDIFFFLSLILSSQSEIVDSNIKYLQNDETLFSFDYYYYYCFFSIEMKTSSQFRVEPLYFNSVEMNMRRKEFYKNEKIENL